MYREMSRLCKTENMKVLLRASTPKIHQNNSQELFLNTIFVFALFTDNSLRSFLTP